MANYADVDFDTWLPAADALTVAVLMQKVPEVPWHNLAASGEQVPEIAVGRLGQLWSDHLSTIGHPTPVMGRLAVLSDEVGDRQARRRSGGRR